MRRARLGCRARRARARPLHAGGAVPPPAATPSAGTIIARENAKTSLERYEAYCEANGLEVHDLTSFEEE